MIKRMVNHIAGVTVADAKGTVISRNMANNNKNMALL